MPFTVTTSDGDMEYGNLEQLKEAFKMGLVGPEDRVRDESGNVRPAKSLPGLVRKEVFREAAVGKQQPPRFLWTLLGMALALAGVAALDWARIQSWRTEGLPPMPAQIFGPEGLTLNPRVLFRGFGVIEWALASVLIALFSRGILFYSAITGGFLALLGGYFFCLGRGVAGALLILGAVLCFLAKIVELVGTSED